MTDAEITIIGAGVIGLAIAEILSGHYRNVFVVEKHPSFGQEISSRNSEVIHAGIYYPEGSFKARFCIEGNKLLQEYCRNHDVPFKICGKLIVATSPEEITIIRGIKENASGNGVSLEFIDQDKIAELEPHIFALGALYSQTTGVIDTHSLMKSLETGTLNNGGQIVYNSEVKALKRTGQGYEITILDADGQLYSFTSGIVINSAGLSSDKISEMAGIIDENLRIRFCKGEYFSVRPPKNRLISRLVYPVPHDNLEGIGIHATIDLSGGVKLGPDVTWLGKNVCDYRVDPSKKEAFWKSAKKFMPFLEPDDIQPDMAGIRPKIQRQGDPVRDFYIIEESARGNPGFVNLIGMESPGMTSCLAIAEYVLKLISHK